MNSKILLCDGIINLALGIPLMIAPKTVPATLGLPPPASGFYAGILGAVLTGIGIALVIGVLAGRFHLVGLGIEVAVCINLFGAGALAGWLLLGDLDIPLRGHLFLWSAVVVVALLTLIEFGCRRREKTVPLTPALKSPARMALLPGMKLTRS